MTQRVNVELHSHTEWSKDCVVNFTALQRACERRGVERIAITDHNTADGALAMARLAPEFVIVGEEIMTTEGELLGYFLQETIPAGLTPEETIRRLREQGAVISVSHPFDRLRKGAWQQANLERILPLVDAIETFNARCLYKADNDQALAFAQAHNVLGTVGSDAHSRMEYGMAMLNMPAFTDATSFRAALLEVTPVVRYSSPWVHVNSKTAKWSKKLGLRRRYWSGG